MFVKWSRRSRPRAVPRYDWQAREPPHQTLIAQLAESKRVDGTSRQRILAHLGTCREPTATARHRLWFYDHCDNVLAGLDLSAEDRAKIAAQLAVRIPRPTDEELAEHWRCIDALGALFRPDGLAALVRAWDAASENERRQFLLDYCCADTAATLRFQPASSLDP